MSHSERDESSLVARHVSPYAHAMPILQLRDICFGFGGAPLLDHANLKIEPGERACLVGRNGSGKSTLLNIISGKLQIEEGVYQLQQNARINIMDQAIPDYDSLSVFEIVAGGLAETGELLIRFHQLSQNLSDTTDDKTMAEFERVQGQLEAHHGWDKQQDIDSAISRLQLQPDILFNTMSGGQKRRVLLARALASKPDLLILDEPTNHLDIESIEWLENFLLAYRGTLLFVTHDRSFLQRLATRIIDLDRGQLTSWDCDYATYLQRKQALIDNQEQQAALFDKRLSQEETWIRQGIKARRTRNEGRVRALKKMREEHRQRRSQEGSAKFHSVEHKKSGKLVLEAENIHYAIEGQPLVKNFSTTIIRGDKIGLIGPNGCGKSTLLKILLGQLDADSGSLDQGTRLEIAYFDQLRSQLDENRSIIDNLADGREKLDINGQERHVISYLQDFLFSPERTRTPVKALSGGECNRLMLAKLFSKPANLLVLDEPTNDLDIDTLELLENLLVEFPGTVLLVSHDRTFLDNVVTDTLVFEGEGRINRYVGGYLDWLRQRPSIETTTSKPEKATAKPAVKSSRKLSYKHQDELDKLPAKIEQFEQRLSKLQGKMADPKLYQDSPDEVSGFKVEIDRINLELASAYQRWEALEDK
ncbi:MAG: ATP-binding cassette domain-containing protein [Gammaproteobacteria bacterium]